MVLFDSYGRPLTNLRIMVTWRCNFACFFCHREGYDKSGGSELTVEEVSVIAEAAKRLDIRYFKITGGEPLVRNDILELIEAIYTHAEKPYISITTNGSLLEKYAKRLAEYIGHVNVSIHSLRRDRFKRITGVDALDKVLRGLREAFENGIKVKINTVLLKGLNEDELGELVELASRFNARLQLIELHPVGLGRNVFTRYHVPYTDAVKWLEKRAVRVKYRLGLHTRPVFTLDNGVEVEVVGPVGNHVFCSACTRMRITYDGKILPCLNWRGEPPVDLRERIRGALTWEEKVEKAIEAIRDANRYRRPGFLWPRWYTGTLPVRNKVFRIGLPKSDGRLVFTGPRAEKYVKALLESWSPFREA